MIVSFPKKLYKWAPSQLLEWCKLNKLYPLYKLMVLKNKFSKLFYKYKGNVAEIYKIYW